MSRFAFKGKSGLIHVYEYIDTAKTSVYFTMDMDGNIVDQIPAHCGTLDSHIKRVALDFNANNDVIPDEKFDNDPHITRSIWANFVSHVPQESVQHQHTQDPTRIGDDFIKNTVNFLKKYSAFLMALWHESKTAFFISVITASIALLLLIPAIALATPVVIVVAITSLMTKP